MRGPLEVAVVGLGVGEQHARAFAASPHARVRWLLDLDAGRTDKVVAAIGQGRPAASLEAILEDPEVDVVSLATYDQEHAAQVMAALAAGKHVFCEKPLCRTRGELVAIRDALARTPHLHLASNLVLRAAPLYRWLGGAIRGGLLGDIYAVDGDYLYGRVHKIVEGWRGGVDQYSVFEGGAIHLVDLIVGLVGERPASVRAVGNQIATRGTRFRYRDFVAATYEFPSGLVGRVTANFGCVHRHQHVLRVFGTKGTFLYDDAGARLHRSRDPAVPAEPVLEPALPATKGDLIPEFIERIKSERDPGPHARRELDVMAAGIAVDQALEAPPGHPIIIEYPT